MPASQARTSPAPDGSDAEVIADVLAGDRRRFAVLVQRHNQTLFRTCRAVLRDDHDAEDAVQSAWLSAFRALDRFRADSSFRTWVTRIAVNEATTRLRQRQKLTPVSDEIPMQPVESPVHHTAMKELAARLERELDELPEGLRTVLVLRDVVELDTAETAAALGIEEENVRVRLHRARQALALALPEVWRFEGERCARLTERVMRAILE
ncbi:MAG: sigma-70 family RNA polymerase sigma factor [Myxococcales bacterium]|nr:sigma-70 family RNA polymerase sigma factor [Myxococcales bacterium]